MSVFALRQILHVIHPFPICRRHRELQGSEESWRFASWSDDPMHQHLQRKTGSRARTPIVPGQCNLEDQHEVRRHQPQAFWPVIARLLPGAWQSTIHGGWHRRHPSYELQQSRAFHWRHCGLIRCVSASSCCIHCLPSKLLATVCSLYCYSVFPLLLQCVPFVATVRSLCCEWWS